MPHEYTRQRQGRDFTGKEYPKNPKAEIRHNTVHNEDDAKKTMLNRLQQYKKQTERGATPIDGHEPPLELPAPEHRR